MDSLLEDNTEILHVFWADGGGLKSVRQSAANLGGAWSSAEVLHSAFMLTQQYRIWGDSTNRVAVAYQSKPTADYDSSELHVMVRVRPSGASSYDAARDLTAPSGMPCFDLNVESNSAGSSIITWAQGSASAIPLSEVYAVLYTSGGTFGTTTNVSDTSETGSESPEAWISESGVPHLMWKERIVYTGPGLSAVLYSQKP